MTKYKSLDALNLFYRGDSPEIKLLEITQDTPQFLSDRIVSLDQNLGDKKKNEIKLLADIIYNSIIHSYLGGKTTYSPYEFQAGVKWFVSEGLKQLPEPIKNKFYQHPPEDFEEYLPLEIIYAVWGIKPIYFETQKKGIISMSSRVPKNLEERSKGLRKIFRKSEEDVSGRLRK